MVNQVRAAVLIAAVLGLCACGGKEKAPAPVPAGIAVPQAAASAPSPAATGAPVASTASVNSPTPAEQYLMKQGVEIRQVFMSRSNLKAIVADSGKERRLFYVTPDGQSLISGMVFDVNGENVTSEDMARFNVRDVGGDKVLNTAQLEDLWKRAGQLRYIAEGKGRPVYVLFDPNCPYCHQLWGSLRKVAEKGDVEIRWLPVAILSDSSKNLAAALYQAKSPVAALTDLGMGTLKAAPMIDKPTVLDLSRNLLLLRDTGYTGVPTLLWKEGDQVRLRMEVPDPQQFAAIFN